VVEEHDPELLQIRANAAIRLAIHLAPLKDLPRIAKQIQVLLQDTRLTPWEGEGGKEVSYPTKNKSD
jgi:hypothetical protein